MIDIDENLEIQLRAISLGATYVCELCIYIYGNLLLHTPSYRFIPLGSERVSRSISVWQLTHSYYAVEAHAQDLAAIKIHPLSQAGSSAQHPRTQIPRLAREGQESRSIGSLDAARLEALSVH